MQRSNIKMKNDRLKLKNKSKTGTKSCTNDINSFYDWERG